MQTRLDTATTRHDAEIGRLNKEIDRLHADHDRDRTQWTSQQETVRSAFESQIALLTQQVQDLTGALDTARTSANAAAGETEKKGGKR